MPEEQEEEIKFTCQNCGKDFEINPDMMVEAGIVEEDPEAEGEEWKLLVEEVEVELETTGICLCLECQDKLAEEND